MESTYYGLNTPHLFSFVTDHRTHEFLTSAHKSLSVCELWDWLRTYQPSRGFMFDDSLEGERIREEMKNYPVNNNHSGSSYAYILREMEYIAKNGYQQYAREYVKVVKNKDYKSRL
jgi:hypothetical protein